ncbi:hypothetical protein [Pseudomonas sp. B35(2017)]|uniref:hypothetical protein n=1 Tax=Pseudomonas sp. B35(2017) TaxID=1981722 RepID=UPI000A1DE6D2|nr:hypothetical protein [Pseudomonas sp. B35(2017)]
MLTDLQARTALKELIEKYLKGKYLDFDRLIEIVQNPSRQVPIKGVLEDIRRHNKIEYTPEEVQLFDNLLYMYG